MENGKKAKNGYLRWTHRVIWPLVRFSALLLTRVFFGFRCRDRCKIKKGESVLVLCNHQTDLDPLCLFPSFSRPIYPVATDSIFTGLRGRVLARLGAIPKKKGASDIRTAVQLSRYLRGGNSVLLFPEGNRYYAEFQYYISPRLAPFIRRTGATLVLFNLRGGSGVSPRFAVRRRRGPFTGEIRRVLSPADYAGMSNDELFCVIRDTLRVFDSEAPARYRSNRRAEYLERMLFVCPRCGALQSLCSEKTRVFCEKCDFSAEYGEDLRLHTGGGELRLVDLWELQKRTVRDLALGAATVFRDAAVKLYSRERGKKKRLLASGEMTASGERLTVADVCFPVREVENASVVSGGKLVFSVADRDYTITGHKRFNPLKYVLLLCRCKPAEKRTPGDGDYLAEDDHAGMEI